VTAPPAGERAQIPESGALWVATHPMSFLCEDGAAIRVEQGEPLLITESMQWEKTSWLVGLLAQGQEVSACLDDLGDIVPLEEWMLR
jgi:hypothetical protein